MSSVRPAELLFIGRPVPEKGLADLLAALSRLRHLDWHLTVIGERPSDIDITMFEPAVTWLGCVTNREVARIMSAHDVLIVPSHYETFGVVALEGLASAMLVIASRTGGLKTLVQDRETGFHFRPGDVTDLARTLGYVIENLSELTTIRFNARAAALRYGWDEVVRQTAVLLARNA